MAAAVSESVGDRNALLAGYRGWLYRVAFEMGARGQDLDDLAQEGYIAMWRALGTYQQGRGSLPSWLTGAARLRMRALRPGGGGRGREFGHEAMRGSVPVDAVVVEDSVLDVLAVETPDGVALAYHQGRIWHLIGSLPLEQQQYVVLRFWYGWTATEIQQVVASNVTWLWHGPRGARARLREALGDLRGLAG